ncbi:MAG: PaREP1 family protein [Nitrososphaerales archaeon]
MSTDAETYLRLNGKFLREAEGFLAKGDYVQASEKLWGAAAEIVKAVAAKRGLELRAHKSISEFVSRLHREKPALRLAEDFHIANSLHTNFYEDWLDPEMVKVGAKAVKRFTSKMQRLL